jgi:integrase
MPLTDTAIRSAKPKAKTYKLADGGGMYLEVAPAGGKWWRLKYRIGGKEKRLSLGVYPDVTLAFARERRDEARKLIADGVDPSENRKAQKAAQAESAANSFETVAREWFAKFGPGWVPGHGDKIIRRLARDIFPWIGKRPITEVTAPELLKVLRRIEERGSIETAHRALQNCGQILRYAIATGRAERDISSDLRGALSPIRGKHHAAITEPKELAPLLRAIHGYEGSLVTRTALQLAPLLFVRPGELRSAEWAHINLDTAEWRYTVTKTKTEHIVPLSRQAVALLRELQPLTGSGRYVFPSTRSDKRPMSDVTLLAALRRLGFSKEQATVHGFRATARTILDEVLGFRPDLMEHQLAHAVRDANGRAYNRTAHLDARKDMMQRWSDYLDNLREGAKVIPIKPRAA